MQEQAVQITIGGGAAATLAGDLAVPAGASGMVLFAHGSGSSRHSPRNRYVAGELQRSGLGTLLLDLLTPPEEARDLETAELRFDIALLAERLEQAIAWLVADPQTRGLDRRSCGSGRRRAGRSEP